MPKLTKISIVVLATATCGCGACSVLNKQNAPIAVETTIAIDGQETIPFQLQTSRVSDPSEPEETLRGGSPSPANRNPFTLLRLFRNDEGKLSFTAEERTPLSVDRAILPHDILEKVRPASETEKDSP